MRFSTALVRLLFVPALLLSMQGRADVPQLTADEKTILESSPGVVLIIASYPFLAKIPDRPLPIEVALFQPRSSGTGFLYRPDGYLVTNAHVVQEANDKDVQAVKRRDAHIKKELIPRLKERLAQAGLPPLNEHEERTMTFRVGDPSLKIYVANKAEYLGDIKAFSDPISVNYGKDIAIVKIDGNNLPTVKLGDSNLVQTGDALTVIGFPGAASPLSFDAISMDSALVPTVTSGRVSAVKNGTKGTPVIQSDATINPGNSGGPAFNSKGEVIGVATYSSSGGAGLNFFVPVNIAMEFIRQAGSLPEEGAFSKTWGSALDAYQAGNWTEAKNHFADTLSLLPNFPDAMRLQVTASQMARSENSTSRLTKSMGGMLWPAVGGMVVLMALVGMLMLRGRTTPQPAHATAGPPPPAFIPTPLRETKLDSIAPPIPKAPAGFGSMHVTEGALKGNQFPIPKAGLLIGRDASKCNVVLADDTVSKEHAWVVPLDNGVVVIDRGSANGTYVNSLDGPSVNKVALRHGDRVFIGKKGAAVLTFFNA